MKLPACEFVSVPKYVVNGWTDRYTIARENKYLLIYLKYDKTRHFVFFPWSENLCIYIYRASNLPTLLLFYFYKLVKILINLQKNCFNKYFTNWNTLQLINNKNVANFQTKFTNLSFAHYVFLKYFSLI